MTFSLGGKHEERRKVDALRSQMYPERIDFEGIGQFQVPTEKAVKSTQSILVAVGDANATDRRLLVVENVGEGVVLISGSADGGGARLFPGQSMRFSFAETSEGIAAVSVYARAETIDTTIRIEEF